MHGINRDSELGIALRRALRRELSQQATSGPASAQSPASAGPAASTSSSRQRSLFGRFAQLMAPSQGRSSNATTSRPRVDRNVPRENLGPTRPDRTAIRSRRSNLADAALQRLTQQGINMERLSNALRNQIMYRRPLPEDLRHALEDVGIRPHLEADLSLVEHPLLDMNVALTRMLSSRPTAPARPNGTRATPLPLMPEREDHENNVSYGMRLLGLNPGLGVRAVVDAFVTQPSDRSSTIDRIRALRKASNAISSQFSQLRPISKADAESEELNFKDSVDYPDDPTACLFGEELSLSNQNQQVIALASISTENTQPYDSTANTGLTFMDLKKLSQYLALKPEPPLTRQALNAETIAQYAFRIVP
ncbi:type III effector (plasmid) [Pseudomonas syringae]|nr:type III effector [Pseudomonas syringae]